MKKFLQSALAVAAFSVATQASAVLINFEDLAVGTTLSDQYAALGATFSANAFTGAGGPTGTWATNTDMTIVAVGGNVGGLGSPSLISGNLLHGFGDTTQCAAVPGWQCEDGDPSFRITFAAQGATSFSAAFAGVSAPADVHVYAYNGSTQIGNVTSAVTTGQYTLSFSAPKITSVVITPGSYDDWVGVDNINYTLAAVPEPETWALMGLGLGVLAFARRR